MNWNISEAGLSCRVLWGTWWHSKIFRTVTLKCQQLCLASSILSPLFLFLRANWKSNLLFLLFTCHFVILMSQTVFCRLPPKGILLIQGMIDAVKFPFWNPLSSFRGSNRKMTWSLVWINSLLLNVPWRCIFGFWYYNIHGSSFLLLPNSYTCCHFGM